MKVLYFIFLALLLTPLLARETFLLNGGTEIQQEQEQFEEEESNTAPRRSPASESDYEDLDLEREEEEYDPLLDDIYEQGREEEEAPEL